MELTEKQKRFCEEYLVDLNATKAYIRAGYSEKGARVSASQLLANPNVSEYVYQLREKQKAKTGVTTEYLINSFKEIADRCMQKVPVMVWELDEEGNRVKVQATDDEGNGIWEFDGATANRSLELLGKHVGFFEVDNSQKTPSSIVGFYLPQNKRDETPSSDNDLDIPVD